MKLLKTKTIIKHMLLFFHICLLIITINSSRAQSHPYQPIVEDQVVVSKYIFLVDTTKKEYKQADTQGKIISKASGWEEINGKKFMKYVASYEDIPFMKEEAVLWRREDETGLYLLQKRDKKYVESLELPDDVSLGKRWSYNDGVESERSVTAILDIALPSGDTYKDCIEVTRQILKVDSLKNFSDKSYYCKDIGSVRTIYLQPTPVGTYITETFRIKSEAAGDDLKQ
ncbi:MAG TPA: hypothetical protein PKA63_02720 [Oligoflexia bacterium]|nr:hypothetical protein [Oligoflexia bacterium]HMP47566.1 hypothetical protein [Oligoflexia bacterium]